MNHHTLILSTAKLRIPEEINIDFVTNLLNRGLTLIEYFGPELDNPEEYIDEDLKAVSDTITYLQFHFDTEQIINYETLSEIEVDQLILEEIKKSTTKDNLKVDDKDILIYL